MICVPFLAWMPQKKFVGSRFKNSSLPLAFLSFTRHQIWLPHPGLCSWITIWVVQQRSLISAVSTQSFIPHLKWRKHWLWAAKSMKDCMNESHLTHSSEWIPFINPLIYSSFHSRLCHLLLCFMLYFISLYIDSFHLFMCCYCGYITVYCLYCRAVI